MSEQKFWCDDCNREFVSPWEPEATVRCPHCGQLWHTEGDVDPECMTKLVAWTTTRAREREEE